MNRFSIILNRAFQADPDGWVHMCPFGDFPVIATDGGQRRSIVQRIDQQAGAQMVRNFNLQSKAKNFAGLLVDFDHESEDTDKRSTAAGWIEGLELRDDGIWARIRWSRDGQDAVDGGSYRYISPVFDPRDMEPVDGVEDTFRPTKLDSAGLTNQPNIKGSVPITNRAPGHSGAVGGGPNLNRAAHAAHKIRARAEALMADSNLSRYGLTRRF